MGGHVASTEEIRNVHNQYLVIYTFSTFNSNINLKMNQGSSVSIVTQLQTGQPGFNSWQGRDFSLYHLWGDQPASYPVGTRGLYLGIKRLRCEADHTTQSSAKVKNA
jgi:hypothetical protein